MNSVKCGIILGLVQFISSTALAGNIYLNGTDVTGARNQRLKDVNVFIDEQGNVFIDAPHYSVNEQAHYIPLSPKLSRNSPSHQAPFGLPSHPEAPPPQLQNEKAGSKVPSEEAAAPDQPATETAPEAAIQNGTEQN